mmetsp:Transcript_15392/g.48401  ORF Transcript_15392/g.48401 Transcript_15392/m.48401 type:complete len:169 (-) Transcript_15392:187-693(-)
MGGSRSRSRAGRRRLSSSSSSHARRPPLRRRSWSPSTEVRRKPSVTPPRRRSPARQRSDSRRRSPLSRGGARGGGGAGAAGGGRAEGKISRIPDGMRDKRFHGYMKHIDKKQGFGFIECNETRGVFERDIFVDLTRLPPGVDRPGDPVTFVLVVGRRGYPEASSVRAN